MSARFEDDAAKHSSDLYLCSIDFYPFLSPFQHDTSAANVQAERNCNSRCSNAALSGGLENGISGTIFMFPNLSGHLSKRHFAWAWSSCQPPEFRPICQRSGVAKQLTAAAVRPARRKSSASPSQYERSQTVPILARGG